MQGLDTDASAVEAVRKKLLQQNAYGTIAVDRFEGDQLPYIDNLVNLFVADDLGSVPMSEVQRVLVPNGVAMLRDADGKWQKTVKPRTSKIDEWSHYLHDPRGTP